MRWYITVHRNENIQKYVISMLNLTTTPDILPFTDDIKTVVRKTSHIVKAIHDKRCLLGPNSTDKISITYHFWGTIHGRGFNYEPTFHFEKSLNHSYNYFFINYNLTHSSQIELERISRKINTLIEQSVE